MAPPGHTPSRPSGPHQAHVNVLRSPAAECRAATLQRCPRSVAERRPASAWDVLEIRLLAEEHQIEAISFARPVRSRRTLAAFCVLGQCAKSKTGPNWKTLAAAPGPGQVASTARYLRDALAALCGCEFEAIWWQWS